MSLAGDALAWWAERMMELIPRRLRGSGGDIANAVLVDPLPVTEPAGLAVALALRQRGRETPLGRLVLGPAAAGATAAARALLGRRPPPAVLLRLPASLLLEREIMLPAAAEPDLGRVLVYEMDRFTPFPADGLFWGWEILARIHGQLRIRLSLVPQAPLAGLIAALRAAGLAPTGLRVAGVDGGVRRIGLAAADAATGRDARRAVRAAAVACALLALVAAGLPTLQQWRAQQAVEARIAQLRPALAEAERLRRQIAGSTGGADVLLAEQARLGSPLRTIATITEILPDDTWLTALSLRQRRISLSGQSADAARLIPRLSSDPTLRDVAFLSPVTRAEPSRAELFAIRLDLGP